jgi:energy-coupling factor transporter ATP-binding protein EcfA2
MPLLLLLQVLLMDEITVDMDVLGRIDLLDFFKQECEQRGATIIYATHIFDGLEGWITHVAYLEEGSLVHGEQQQQQQRQLAAAAAAAGRACLAGAAARHAWLLVEGESTQQPGSLVWDCGGKKVTCSCLCCLHRRCGCHAACLVQGSACIVVQCSLVSCVAWLTGVPLCGPCRCCNAVRMQLSGPCVTAGGPRSILPQMGPGKKLLHVVEEWLRKERDARRAKTAAAAASCGAEQQQLAPVVPSRTPLMPNKHLAFFR